MMTVVVESDYMTYLSALNMGSVFLWTYHFLTDNSVQSADKAQQESHAMAEKLHDAVIKIDRCRNLQQHREVFPAIARHLVVPRSRRFGHNE